MGTARKPPERPGPGRPKGSKNKLTMDIKSMIVAALDKAGGEDYLLEQARNNPGSFLTLLGKVIPTQVQGDPTRPISIEVKYGDLPAHVTNMILRKDEEPD